MCVCAMYVRFRLQVHWFQQQHEKKRKKRDFENAPYAFVGFPPLFDFRPRSRHIGTTQQSPRIRASLPLQNLFTDPLFKEQWYLVSRNLLSCRRRAIVSDGIRDVNRTRGIKDRRSTPGGGESVAGARRNTRVLRSAVSPNFV